MSLFTTKFTEVLLGISEKISSTRWVTGTSVLIMQAKRLLEESSEGLKVIIILSIYEKNIAVKWVKQG